MVFVKKRHEAIYPSRRELGFRPQGCHPCSQRRVARMRLQEGFVGHAGFRRQKTIILGCIRREVQGAPCRRRRRQPQTQSSRGGGETRAEGRTELAVSLRRLS